MLAASDPQGFYVGFHQVATLDQLFSAGNNRVYVSDISLWGYNEDSGYRGLSVVTSSDAPEAPEPGTWSMPGLGVLGLGYRARSRRKA